MIYPKAAFGYFAAQPEGMIQRHDHCLDKYSTQPPAGAVRGQIVRIAGDPQGINSMTFGQGQKQANRAFGKMAAPVGRVDVVADVAVIEFQILGMADAQRDSAGDREIRVVVIAHPPVIGGHRAYAAPTLTTVRTGG
jgi:hypothetical protein